MARGPNALVALTLLLASVACVDHEIHAIERLAAAPTLRDRGRVQVRDGNVLTDKGTRLRGVTVGVDFQPDEVFGQSLFEELAKSTGLNTCHVFLENYQDPTGKYAAQADTLVELTSNAGMYLVLAIGAGDRLGSFDAEKVRSFWSFYAGRYADRTHVLYEIQNVPELGCDAPFQPATLQMELEAHALIRAQAPESHVLLLSSSAVPSPSALTGSLAALEGGVDWSRASVAFHGNTECVAAADLGPLLSVTRARRIAAVISEVPTGSGAQQTVTFEENELGWFSFDWLVNDRDLLAFKEQHMAAGASWCPDFGNWPQVAELCRAP